MKLSVCGGKKMSDAIQRNQAIDVTKSCIVQAPAGSGKTELLIQRMLGLLACVDDAKHILAITFTNKAAAEMRDRILGALKSAAEEEAPSESHKLKTWQLAQAVIQKHGDRLLRNPGQLTIQTIDSFNATLVRRMPWLSRFGSVPEISDDPEVLYQTAVEQLLGQLSVSSDGDQPLQILLRHLDNQVLEVQRLLVNMLRRRDQWLGVLMQHSATSRDALQGAVELYCQDELLLLKQSCPVALSDELLWCARYAISQLDQNPGRSSLELNQIPTAQMSAMGEWLFIADLLLKSDGDIRKQVTKNNGFPSGKEHKPAKDRMKQLLDDFGTYPDFIQRLKQIKRLPKEGYSEDQWAVLKSLIDLLPMLVGELWLVFRAHGQVDFGEIALKAIQALGDSDNPSDLLLKIDQNLKHILVDEFQDTSRLQYRLLTHLISGWSEGDGRSLFLVGDPMQSIYRFREAEVGLFLHCFKGEFGDNVKQLQPLQLTANFRSQKGIVDWINTTFEAVFPKQADEMTGAVPLTCAEAAKIKLERDACHFYPSLGRNDVEEAKQVVEIIKQAKAEDPQQSIAVLVRGRNHLAEILPLLRQSNIPYQAQDIDLLGAKSAALDIVHLTRALLHCGDRLSWLAVLRAPWCGLTLKDLTVLLADSGQTVPALLARTERWQLLSSDGQKRLQRVWSVLSQSLEQRGRLSLRTLIESCWLSLGGRDCCSEDALTDVLRVFDLLENLDKGSELQSFEHLDRGLKRLFAEPDSASDGTLQIMTIHKSKGLEFDTVIIPGLGKMPRHQDATLLRWFDHPDHGLLMAPVNEKGRQEKDPLYQVLSQIEAEKGAQETARLLYVATTRAINSLHLLGHAKEDSKGQISPQRDSLLEKLWPVVRDHFADVDRQPDAKELEIASPSLTRLPTSWTSTQLTSVKLAKSAQYDVPSEKSEMDSDYDMFSGWEDPIYRIIGNVVHQQLELIATKGVGIWLQQKTELVRDEVKRSLQSSGVSKEQLGFSTERVLQALDCCLEGDKGRWIIDSHEQHVCELPLSGVVNEKVVHAIIDRTFIADGVRWVIDYKTSTPQVSESTDAFYKREAEKYKKQLNTYAQLFRLLNDVPVRTALYFPMFDGWFEVS
jgi:ATP-dependent helicase/nuclease subunit A